MSYLGTMLIEIVCKCGVKVLKVIKVNETLKAELNFKTILCSNTIFHHIS